MHHHDEERQVCRLHRGEADGSLFGRIHQAGHSRMAVIRKQQREDFHQGGEYRQDHRTGNLQRATHVIGHQRPELRLVDRLLRRHQHPDDNQRQHQQDAALDRHRRRLQPELRQGDRHSRVSGYSVYLLAGASGSDGRIQREFLSFQLRQYHPDKIRIGQHHVHRHCRRSGEAYVREQRGGATYQLAGQHGVRLRHLRRSVRTDRGKVLHHQRRHGGVQF